MTPIPHLDGCVLVARGGEVLYRAAHGYADARAALANTAATRFQLASVSKQFTATAILQLAQENRLSLTDRLGAWMPETPPAWREATIHQLLTHTSGAGHWQQYDIDFAVPMPSDRVVAAFLDRDPIHPPGERFHYSSPGYGLAAHIVERAADMDYRQYLRRHIFEPVGMTATFAGNADGHTDTAAGYGGGVPVPSFDLDVLGMGAGDLWSTVDDLWRWNRAFAAGVVLREPLRSQAFHPHVVMNPAPLRHYGYGRRITTIDGHTVVYHTGENPGFRCGNAWFTDLDTTVVYTCNNADRFNTDEEVFGMFRAGLALVSA